MTAASDAAICASCGAAVATGAKACGSCGHPLGPQPRAASDWGPPITGSLASESHGVAGPPAAPGGGGWKPAPDPAGGSAPHDRALHDPPTPHSAPYTPAARRPVQHDAAAPPKPSQGADGGRHQAGIEAARDGSVQGQVRHIQSRVESRGDKYQINVWTFRVERYDDTGNRTLLVPVEMRGQSIEGSISDGDWVRARGKVRDGTLRATEVSNLTTGAVVRAKGTPAAVVVLFVVFFLVIVAFIAWVAWSIISGNSGPPDGFPDFPNFPDGDGAPDLPDLPGDGAFEVPAGPG